MGGVDGSLILRILCPADTGYFALPITPSTYQSKLPILSPPQDSPSLIRTTPLLSVTGPVKGLKPPLILAAEASTSARTSGGTAGPKGATPIIPCPSPN